MATSTIIIASIEIALTRVFMFVFGKMYSLIGSSDVSSVLIPYDEPKLIQSLQSSNTALIALDSEIDQSLDSDDKNSASTGNLLSSRKVYLQCEKIATELIGIHKSTSNSVNRFVFDYHALKSGKTGPIIYLLPSDAYYQELKKQDNWNDVQYQSIKNELMAKKSGKIVVYNSFADLQQLFIDKFNFSLKV